MSEANRAGKSDRAEIRAGKIEFGRAILGRSSFREGNPKLRTIKCLLCESSPTTEHSGIYSHYTIRFFWFLQLKQKKYAKVVGVTKRLKGVKSFFALKGKKRVLNCFSSVILLFIFLFVK